MKSPRSITMLSAALFLANTLFAQQSAQPRAPKAPASAASPSAEPAAQTTTGVLPEQQAAVPRLIKFNGVLHDLSGKPLSGPVDVTFTLYADEAGGNALWFETQAASDGFSGAEIEQGIVSALYAAHAMQQTPSPAHVVAEFRKTRPLAVLMREHVGALRAWARDRTVAAD